MGRALDEHDASKLLDGLSETRDEIATTLGALRGLVDESLEWRSWVRRHPWPAVGAALFVGWRLGRGRWL